jgi:adenosylcobinamide kinase/adenosylcobinamide-phosphate guanylyltransferase
MTSLFVLGGARSGKSRYAQARAEALRLKPVYLATAEASDDEMRDRIARHRTDRGPSWQTIDAPVDLPGAIAAWSAADRVLLVDCLTLWTSNLILGDRACATACDALMHAIARSVGPLILVANEVGLGIVPDNALARRFRDEAGFINQRVAAAVDEVQFLAAGLPLRLK